MRFIINIFKFLFLIILLIKPLSASITDDLLKLSKMYDNGTLTSEEFSKAKKILLQLDELESSKIDKPESIPANSEKVKKVKKKITKKKS
tara:strand:- start:210 stop:479 length:270 start_codon:yes stop_codon:yes gene_type:complete